MSKRIWVTTTAVSAILGCHVKQCQGCLNSLHSLVEDDDFTQNYAEIMT